MTKRAKVTAALIFTALVVGTSSVVYDYLYTPKPLATTATTSPTQSTASTTTATVESSYIQTSASPSSSSQNATVLPAHGYSGIPPQILLDYRNVPFHGTQGSSCLPSELKVVCLDVPLSTNASTVLTVAVYPNPSISFSVYGYPENNPGSQLVATLYSVNPLSEIYSRVVANSLTLNFSSGEYLITANYSSGAEFFSTYFLLSTVIHANQAVDDGIRIEVGNTNVHMTTFLSSTFPGWEDWPITVYSNSTTNVDLSARSVIDGAWAQIVPSHLTNVGPQGATAEMLIAGAVRPNGINDQANSSLMVAAYGSDGLSGNASIPVEGLGGIVPVNPSGQSSSWLETIPWTAERNYSTTGAFAVVYDPGGVPSNQNTSVKISLMGMLNGTIIQPMPPWLSLTVSNPPTSITAYAPSWVDIQVFATNSAPFGMYYAAFQVDVGSQVTYVTVEISVIPPIKG